MRVNRNKANIWAHVQPIYIYIYIYQNSIVIVFKPLMLTEGPGCSVAPEVRCTRLTYMRGFKIIDYVCIRRDSRALVHAECGCSNYYIQAE